MQFAMEKSQTRLHFLDILINKSGAKIWMGIYNKSPDSKRYVPFTSNHPQHCLTNIPFSLARRICTIVKNENVKEKRFKELQKTFLEQKYPRSLIEASILRAKEIPLEILRQPKLQKMRKLFLSLLHTIPTIQKQTMSNIFQRKKLVKSMSQAPNLDRLLSRSIFESQHNNNEVKKCGKNCVSCP